MTLAERFWPNVEKGDGCWNWTGARIPSGYGSIGIQGTQVGAHRVAYELEVGAIPEGMFVCHHCDNKQCVRPDHLYLGTPKKNSEDAVARGRMVLRERHPNSKLTEAQVREIRSGVAAGQTQTSFAKRFNVSARAVQFVVRGATWRGV